MKNLKLSVKLVGGFIIVAVITLAVGLVGWMGISNSQKVAQEVKGVSDVNAEMLQREIDHLAWARKVGQFQRNENLTTLAVEKDPHKCAFGKWYYSDQRKAAETKIPGIAPLLKQVEEPHTKLHSSAVELEKLLQKGKEHRGEALAYYQNVTGTQLANVQKVLEEIRANVKNYLGQEEKTAATQADRIKTISLAGMILGAVVALTLGIILTMSITRPINRIIAGLNDGSQQISSAASQVSGASQQLAQGASEQAAALEETSSSLEEMASMTRQNAENANQANLLINETGRVVDQANHSMTDLTGSMKEISAASDETAKIIKTIDEIAFQTNLLALNAAVEAARAGEAGAGFAVVADEVRNLAMRAADAAKNTANLIETTVIKVKDGSALVNKTAEAFSQVASSTVKAKELVGEIAAASDEQAQGVDQINRAVGEMDKVVQQNAANAEESASASEELSAQSEQMNSIVGELVAMVGGSANHQGSAQLSLAHQGDHLAAAKYQDARMLPPPAKPKRKGEKPRNATPEQVIPLDEGDFKDF
ncbi:MAG: methyl-accepting chemotaxis protein [Thermodesulfobacteriota bacterium]